MNMSTGLLKVVITFSPFEKGGGHSFESLCIVKIGQVVLHGEIWKIYRKDR